MEPTNEPKPEATLRLSWLDTNVVTALTKHYLVTVEQQENEIIIKLYKT